MEHNELGPADLVGIAQQMRAGGTDPAGPLSARLIAGGRSNLTFRLDDGESAWVMRTPPRAGRTPSAHDVAREYRVVEALGPTGVPVAPAVTLCEDEGVIGAPFAVCGFVEGRAVQARDELDALGDDQVDAAVEALADTLAALHRVDHVAVGLERFGRPDAYAARQLRRWTGQWEIVGDAFPDDVRALADRLVSRLADRLPVQASTGIVHGDFRLDNTLVRLGDDDTVSVGAVVDWELSTIGDPVADVANMCVQRQPAFDLVIGSPCAWTSSRLPDTEGLAAAYEKAGGVPLLDLEQHLALADLKLAVIAAGIDHRYRAGAAHGAGFDTAGQAVPLLLEAGLAHLS